MKAEKFIENILYALEEVAPKKKFKIPKAWAGKRWFTDNIKVAADRRDKAYYRAIYTRTEQDWKHFKIERNAVLKLIKSRKKEYYELMIDNNRNDPKLL